MGTGPRQLRAANLGFGKWLQRGTERSEPEEGVPEDGVPPFFLSEALGGSGADRVHLASRP